MRRALIAATGLLLAFVAGVLALSILVVREALSLSPKTSLDLLGLAAWTGGVLGPHALTLLWGALLAVCFAPVAIVAALCEATRLRSGLVQVGATGLLTAAVPTLARGVLQTSPGTAAAAEARLTVLLFLTGVVSGAAYWLVAGRAAPR